MADTPPNNPLPGAPTGAAPLKKSTGKVQPKKETVRINLPPKPTAAPTIKLPTLPPGGPTGAPSPAPISVASAAAPVSAPKPAVAAPPAPVKSSAAPAAAPAASQRPATPASRPAMAPAAPALKSLDKALIFSAAVASLVAVGLASFVLYKLKDIVDGFTS
jgi:hypothetical protein